MTITTAPLYNLGTARCVAYDWHGGQASGLYSFASTGEPTTRDLERAITEVNQDRACLPGGASHSEHRRLGNLLKYLEWELDQRTDREGDDDA